MKTSTLTRAALLAFASLALSTFAFADAKGNWTAHCAKCHGADGAGNTAIGKKLKLQDYTSADVQAKMTDEEINHAITNGVTVNGKERMAAFKDKLSEQDITDLTAFIRSLKK